MFLFKTCILFTFLTALHRLGILSIDYSMQVFYGTSNNSSSFFGLSFIVIRLSSARKFSMGFKSGDCAGHFIIFTLPLHVIAEPFHLCVLDRYHADVPNNYDTIDKRKE